MASNDDDLKELGAAALGLKVGEPDFDQLAREAREKKKTEVQKSKDDEKLEEIVTGEEEPTPEQAVAIRAAKKARISQVLSKGILGEKLKGIYYAAVPEGYKGKFVRDKPEDIIRHQNLGFGFTYREGADDGLAGLHATADGKVRVGDVVLMTISQEDQEILREVRTERLKGKLTQARREYTEKASEFSQRGGPASFDESQTVIEKGRIIDRR